MGEKLLEKVFSIKNDKDGRHKVVRVLGAKLKINKLEIDSYQYNDKNLSTNFYDRVKLLIKNCIPYYFPEKKYSIQYVPEFDKAVKIDTNSIRNFIKYNKALKKFYKEFDVKSLENIYNRLNDNYSKEMYLNIIVHRLFDCIKTRFPLFYGLFYEYLEKLEVGASNVTDIVVPEEFKIIDLNKLGYKGKLLYSSLGIHMQFILQQYNYKNFIKVENGDFVLDCGACYGDSAVYFANMTGDNGKVFSFEFVKENIPIFYKNIELNPDFKNVIQLIERPIWSDSCHKFYPVIQGPGSYVSTVKAPNSYECTTISIDDFVKENNIERVDFIKMDIEGSELAALKGAYNTLKQFHPKLAICLYHKKEDLWEIPQYLIKNFPEYELYVNHYSCNFTESVLFARVK